MDTSANSCRVGTVSIMKFASIVLLCLISLASFNTISGGPPPPGPKNPCRFDPFYDADQFQYCWWQYCTYYPQVYPYHCQRYNYGSGYVSGGYGYGYGYPYGRR